MNPLDQLSDYLRRMERNLRVLALARGAGLLFGCALAATLVLVLIMSRLSFSDPSVLFSRLLLFSVLAAALCLGLIVPVVRLNQRRAAREAERLHPEFRQRLLTFVERRDAGDPFLPLLAADTLPVAGAAAPDIIAAPSRAAIFGFLAVSALLVLVWMGMRGPGYLGYGTSLLWSVPGSTSSPLYSIAVEPGDRRIRRHSDQIVRAQLNGFFSRQASLFVRYASATKWEETPMRPQSEGAGFDFLLVGIPEDLEYYVGANGVKSPVAKLTAVDLPAVKKLRVTYRFPPYYGMREQTEDPGGDLRAVEGTVADVEVETDKPLASGFVQLDDGTRLDLTGTGTTHHVSVPIRKDGSYHVATIDSSQPVRLSDDYFIEARKDSPPTIAIARPVRDARVTPIEEVPVEVQARDDFGLSSLDLHYSVNGGPEQVKSLLRDRGAKESTGSLLLSMEDFKIVPGDVVSLYATARDAKTTARSDIMFVEARPFEYTYRQDQASGGNGGSQDEPKIAERQKEIIAATFNQIKSDKKDAKGASEDAKYLSGVQSKLRAEAQSLADRMKSRQLAGANPAFQQFVSDMEAAVAVMGPAATELQGQRWQSALSPEQKALQFLLRAEAIFRDVQVQMGRGGGGGAGGSGASRDLEGLTSLELDTQKNQYESGSQSAADQRQKEADEALKKLEELAKRQQQLAQQAQSKQNFQQRWEQEMLRRQAEQLRQQIEQLTRNQQQGQQGQQAQQGQSGQKGQGRQTSRSGNSAQGSSPMGGRFQTGTRQALEQTLQNLTDATRDMSNAASHGSQADAQRAAERLRQAQSELSNMRQSQNDAQVGDITRQAQKLAERQSGFDEKLRRNFADGASADRTDQQNAQLGSQMAEEKRRMIDDLHQLEHGMQQAARSMQNTQPGAAKKLRDAIGDMQQREIESRMKWTADALSKGLGSYAVMREAPVTQVLNELSDKLRDVEASANAPRPGEGEGQQALEQALQRAQKLRRDIEAMARQGSKDGQKDGAGREPGDRAGEESNGKTPGQTRAAGQQRGNGQEGQNGQQAGSSQSGSDGQSSGRLGGSREARGGQSSFGPATQPGSDLPSSAARGAAIGHAGVEGGGGWDAMNLGDWQPPDPATVQRSYDEALRELGRLEQSVRSDPATAKEMQLLLGELQHLDPRRFPGNPRQLAELEARILSEVDQAELVLRRKVEDGRGSVRTPSPQDVPPGYADSVAEYFRKLSH